MNLVVDAQPLQGLHAGHGLEGPDAIITLLPQPSHVPPTVMFSAYLDGTQ